MTNPLTRRILATLTVLAAGAATLVGSASSGQATEFLRPQWIGTWGAAITGPSGTPGGVSNGGVTDSSIRMLVRTSIAGDALRVRISNAFGNQPVVLGRVTVARPNAATPELHDIDAATVRELTFNGSPSVTMWKGADVLSDPVNLAVPALADLVVTIYLPGTTGPIPWHWQARQTSYVYPGDHTTDVSGAGFTVAPTNWFYLAGVDVRTRRSNGTVVVLGDSIWDGFLSTFGANTRVTDFLAARIVNTWPAWDDPGVLNESISGNKVTHDGPGHTVGISALARLDTDVYGQTGVRSVIVQLGLNDVFQENDPADRIIAGLRQIGQQLREKGLRTLVCTLTPFGTSTSFTPEREAVRQAVNTYIRTTGDFDTVIDQDAVVRDPADPTRLRAEFDAGDGVHPNDAGSEAIAKAVPLGKL